MPDICPECDQPELHVHEIDPALGAAGPCDLQCEACGWDIYLPAETKARTRIEALRRIVKSAEAARIDGYIVDMQTANMLVTVYGALSRDGQERFGVPNLERLVMAGWKAIR